MQLGMRPPPSQGPLICLLTLLSSRSTGPKVRPYEDRPTVLQPQGGLSPGQVEATLPGSCPPVTLCCPFLMNILRPLRPRGIAGKDHGATGSWNCLGVTRGGVCQAASFYLV